MRIRGFEIVSEYKGEDIILPKRNTSASAGYDFYSAIDIKLNAKEITVIPTGVKSYMMCDDVLYIYIRSSLAFKKGLTLANSVGVIDADYYNNVSNEGHILIAIMNNSLEAVEIKKGDRIAQGVFSKYETVDNDSSSNKISIRQGGIGSTGK